MRGATWLTCLLLGVGCTSGESGADSFSGLFDSEGSAGAAATSAGSPDEDNFTDESSGGDDARVDDDGDSNIADDAIAVSPNGRHAVVYFNVDLPRGSTSGSFQDLSVVLLEGTPKSVSMTVGFRPSAVTFSADGERAFVVTETGVSVIVFDAVERKGAHIAATVPLGEPDEEPVLDVSITPDGRYALGRRATEAVLRLVDLNKPNARIQTLDLRRIFAEADAKLAAAQAEERRERERAEEAARQAAAQADAGSLPEAGSDAGVATDAGLGDAGDSGATHDEPAEADSGVVSDTEPEDFTPADPEDVPFTDVTDIDLSPSGEFAIAVVRDRRTVLSLPVPAAFQDPTLVTVVPVGQEVVGSVVIAPDEKRALLYTTALDEVERISVFDLSTNKLRVVGLPKAVLGVTLAQDGEAALVVHRKLEGDPNQAGIEPDTLIDRSYGYSLLRLEDGFSKLQLTQAPLGPSVIVPDAGYLFILFDDPAQGLREVHRVGLESFLVRPVGLGSAPRSIGALPGANKVFVGQEHSDGRITFIDWDTLVTDSVTGFELNSRIRE